MLAGCAVTSSGGTQPHTPTHGPLKQEAADGCHAKVKNLLKSPDTAKWDSTKVTRQLLPGRFTVVGEVSSDNSFGALVQSPYTCTVRWTGSSANQVDHFRVHPTVL
jgi:hypothetical protein